MDKERSIILMLLSGTSIGLENLLNRVKDFQIHEINMGRKTASEYSYLFPILKKYNDKFQQYMRMLQSTFQYILSKIEGKISKNWCNFHTQPILPEERLVLTLRYY